MTARHHRARAAVETHVGFGHFLRSVTSPALLDAEEEADLGKRVAAGFEADRMLGTPSDLRPIRKARLRRISIDGTRAAERLVLANTRLAVNMARRFSSAASRSVGEGEYGLEERIQEAMIGLTRAATKFDATKGYRFTTYASWWIRQSLQRGTYRAGAVRLPAHKWEELTKLWGARNKIVDAGGIVNAKTLAMVSGMTRDKVRSLLELEPRIAAVRLDQAVGDGGTRLVELLATSGPGPADEALVEDRGARLGEEIGALDERDALILRMRFGLEDDEEHTLEAIGERLGLTRERVRQLQNSALEKLARSERLKALL